MRKALAVYRKEWRQIRRDRLTLSLLVFVPVLLLLLYGYALNFDIRHVRLAVEDRDGTPESRAVVSAFINSGYFDLAAPVHDRAASQRMLDLNEARALLVIPEGFSREVATGRTAPVQVIINGDNANTATTVMGYSMNILRAVGAELAGGTTRPAPSAPPLTVQPRVWYNPELRSPLFLVPGLIAIIAMITAVISTALSIVREKESGTIEQVRMAPMGTVPFVVGKTIPYFLVSLASGTLVILSAMALFGLPAPANWLALFVALSLFLIGALATGLFVSTLSDSQQLAFQIAALVSILPTIMLSGFVFPLSSMPAFLQVISHVVLARYFLVALRGIVLKGTDLAVLAPQVLAMAAYAVLMLGLASIRLKREQA